MNSVMRVARCLFAVLGMAAFGLWAQPVQAVLQVDITRGNVDPLPIAIPDFQTLQDVATDAGTVSEIGANMSAVIIANLERSGLFRALDPASFIRQPSAAAVRPRFANWRAIAASTTSSR